MSNRTFDILAYIGRIVLPALATLVIAVSQIWGLPYGEAIAGTITAIAVFLNAILKTKTTKYERELTVNLRDEDDRSDNAKGEEKK